ncbi:MAG: septum formation initiator family protein [Geminicoccaceae bacterium]
MNLRGLLAIDWMPLRRMLKRRWVPVILILGLAYFGWHGIHGGRGLIAWLDLNREVELVKAELEQVRGERQTLERRIAGLQPDAIDPDMLDEELRKLGYIGEREVLILVPRAEEPAR